MEGEPSVILPLPVLVHDLGTGAEDSQTQYSISSQASAASGAAASDVLRDHRCFETPQGWMLALDPASLHTFLWRPHDGERVRLPPLDEALPLRCKCLLSHNSVAKPGCVVVVFDLDDSKMWTCSVGASEWDSHRYQLAVFLDADADVPREKNMAKCHGMAAVGGKIYYEMTADELGFIRFNGDGNPELDTMAVDVVDLPPSMPVATTYLVESRGELFLVVVFFDGDNVHKVAEHAVYKMDFSEPAWCKVGSIGDDRAFLLGGDRIGISSFGASCSTAYHGGGLRGNCIYFLNHMAITENFLHVIDVGKGTEQVQRPFRHKGYMMPVRPPFWLVPTECNP